MPGRRMACRMANDLKAQRILEVGVGTGLSLPMYNRDTEVVGIDVSKEMLKVARRRVEKNGLTNVTLCEMDVEATDLPPASFEVVVASYVLSVVPTPHRALREMRRLCAPEGTIVICNYSSDSAWFPKRLAMPFSRNLGWRLDFCLCDELKKIGLEIADLHKIPPFGLFTLATCVA